MTIKKILLVEKKQKEISYSPWIVHWAGLPCTHTSLTGVNTHYLDCRIPMVFSWLLFFDFLRGLLPHLVFWGDGGDLLSFWSYNLGNLIALQKGNILGQYFILELLQVFYPLPFVFLFYKPSLFSLFPCLSLGYLSCLLSSMLNTAGLCCLFQVGLEPSLLFMPPLHFTSLLFKYFGIVLGNVKENGRRYGDTEER